MPKRLGSTLLFLTLLSFPLPLLAGGVIQTENFTYPLAGNGKFTVEEANGSITISSWDRSEVAITATKHAESQADLDAIRIDIKQESDSIDVRTIYSSPGPHNGGVAYQIVVPKAIAKLIAKTANGSVSTENVGGDVTMKSENGAITATDLKGSFTLVTTNGSITAGWQQAAPGNDPARIVSIRSVASLLPGLYATGYCLSMSPRPAIFVPAVSSELRGASAIGCEYA